jgi:hypothetical protein
MDNVHHLCNPQAITHSVLGIAVDIASVNTANVSIVLNHQQKIFTWGQRASFGCTSKPTLSASRSAFEFFAACGVTPATWKRTDCSVSQDSSSVITSMKT